jgi:hypothetical protein
MSRHLIGCLIIALAFHSPAPAVAEPSPGFPAVYETVDAVEAWGSRIIVTGIISGQQSLSELSYTIYDGTAASASPEAAARCDRLAMLAMAKPGKYQFATVEVANTFGKFGCKLIVRAP